MDRRFVDMLTGFLKFLGDKQITEESKLRDLGLDSMQSIELLFAIEDTFGVSLPDESLTESTFASAGSLWQAVAATGVTAQPAEESLTR
jgi:acyl carrier protein